MTGGAIGGTLGLLAGIGTLAIPGLGPFIAPGPIIAALSGAAAAAAAGALVVLGIPEYEAKVYEDRIKKAGIWWRSMSRTARREMLFGTSRRTTIRETFPRSQKNRTK